MGYDTTNIIGLTGNIADVDANNRLTVEASMLPAIAAAAHETKEAYSWTTVTADIDTGDTAFLLCNNSSTKHLHITRVYVWADVSCLLQFHFPTYSASFTGTAVTGIPLNRSSAMTADVVAYADETANTQANLFLTLRTNEVGTDEFGQWVDFGGAVILGYHNSLAIDISGESGAFNTGVMGYFHSHS